MDTGEKDKYRTLAKATEMVLVKERKSKFYGYAYPLQSEAEVKPLLEKLQKIHPTANHFCYAWQLGVRQVAYRTNDDGEPNNSAGAPNLWPNPILWPNPCPGGGSPCIRGNQTRGGWTHGRL